MTKLFQLLPSACRFSFVISLVFATQCLSASFVQSQEKSPVSGNTSQQATRPKVEIVAHRGFSAVAPENTLAAIEAAIKAGATGCEFDVYACGSGEIVLMHDKTVNRTTNGKGKVTELSLQQLRQLDAGSWKDPRYQGEKTPLLSEALQLLKGSGCQPVIEIKMEGIAQRVIEDVRKAGMTRQVAIIAFSSKVVHEVRTIEPKIECAWLCSKAPGGTTASKADWLEKQALECKAKVLDLGHKMLSAEMVAALKQRGFGVWTWTVNDKKRMTQLEEWGVDSITTDRPDLLTGKTK